MVVLYFSVQNLLSHLNIVDNKSNNNKYSEHSSSDFIKTSQTEIETEASKRLKKHKNQTNQLNKQQQQQQLQQQHQTTVIHS